MSPHYFQMQSTTLGCPPPQTHQEEKKTEDSALKNCFIDGGIPERGGTHTQTKMPKCLEALGSSNVEVRRRWYPAPGPQLFAPLVSLLAVTTDELRPPQIRHAELWDLVSVSP